MAILRIDNGAAVHWCEGCRTSHVIPIESPPYTITWQFNNDENKPTFSPSVKHFFYAEETPTICHYHIVEGNINYCTDSTHTLAGLSLPLKNVY